MMIKLFRALKNVQKISTRSIRSLTLSEEILDSLKHQRPILALESTIITHGMPYPINLETIKDVEAIVRGTGVTPATIGVLNGEIKVGLSLDEIKFLSQNDRNNLIKISRRDLPFAVARSLSGGTTVSATMLIARKAGIKFFATGGIGGVHRDFNETFDVSADLKELGQTSVTVFSSGIKSILDIGKSLEYLETEGVPVCTLNVTGNENAECQFPSFFTASSEHRSPFTLGSVEEAAKLIDAYSKLNLCNGMLIAIPVPENSIKDGEIINAAIEQALNEARENKISGKQVTPYILKRVTELTKGLSLKLNIDLIKNNAKIASRVIIKLNKMKISKANEIKTNIKQSKPVVIGGSVIDIIIKSESEALALDETTYKGKSFTSVGGVARNIADCLSKLNKNVLFITAISTDENGKKLLQNNSLTSKDGFKLINEQECAKMFVLMNGKGEMNVIIGENNEINQQIDIEHVNKFVDIIKNSPLVVVDGNVPSKTINHILKLCSESGVPVWFEPTDPRLVVKILDTDENNRSSLQYFSPNFLELKVLAEKFRTFGTEERNRDIYELNEMKNICIEYSKEIFKHFFQYIFITLGANGVLLISKTPISKENVLPIGPNLNLNAIENTEEIFINHFPAIEVTSNEIVNRSGAGDCFAAATIAGIIDRKTISECIQYGKQAAILSLKANETVPSSINENLFYFD